VERTDAEKVSRLIMKKVKKMGIARDWKLIK
jgi:hypothetical protein